MSLPRRLNASKTAKKSCVDHRCAKAYPDNKQRQTNLKHTCTACTPYTDWLLSALPRRPHADADADTQCHRVAVKRSTQILISRAAQSPSIMHSSRPQSPRPMHGQRNAAAVCDFHARSAPRLHPLPLKSAKKACARHHFAPAGQVSMAAGTWPQFLKRRASPIIHPPPRPCRTGLTSLAATSKQALCQSVNLLRKLLPARTWGRRAVWYGVMTCRRQRRTGKRHRRGR